MNALPPNQIYIEILKRVGRTDVVVFLAMCCPVVHGPKPLEKKKKKKLHI